MEKTHRRGRVEARGKKRLLSRSVVLKMNRVRKDLITKTKNDREIRWKDVIKKARVPKVERCTALRAFHREGIPVAARTPREKPQREKAHAQERVGMCTRLAKHRSSFFTVAEDTSTDQNF